jgi:hypothetical protein
MMSAETIDIDILDVQDVLIIAMLVAVAVLQTIVIGSSIAGAMTLRVVAAMLFATTVGIKISTMRWRRHFKRILECQSNNDVLP